MTEPFRDARSGGPTVVAHPERRTVRLSSDGPALLEGPVELVMPDGRRVHSDRPVTALCLCRRSRRYPFCDTSHRRKVRAPEEEA